MDENLTIRQKELLKELLAHPANNGSSYISDLQDITRMYPQSGLFKALYGRSLHEKDAVVAGAYFEGAALHKVFYNPENLDSIMPEEVLLQPDRLMTPVANNVPHVEHIPAEQIYYQTDHNSDILTDEPEGFPEVLHVSPIVHPVEEFIHKATPGPVIDTPAVEEKLHSFVEEHVPPVVAEKIPEIIHEPVVPTIEERLHAIMEERMAPVVADKIPEIIHEPIIPAFEEKIHSLVEEHVPLVEAGHIPEVIHEPIVPAVEEKLPETVEERVKAVEAKVESTRDKELVWPVSKAAEKPASAEEAILEQAWAPVSSVIPDIVPAVVSKAEDFVPVARESNIHEPEIIEQADMVREAIKPVVAEPLAPPPVTTQPVPVITPDPVAEAPIAHKPEPEPPVTIQPVPVISEQVVAPPVTVEAKQDAIEEDVFDETSGIGDLQFPKVQAPAAVEDPVATAATPAPEYAAAPATAKQEEVADDNADQNVSKYHDEKMPRSFMWWLNKTRKEHGDLYQPYVKAPASPAVTKNKAPVLTNELQQQYMQSILHVSPVTEFQKDTAASVEFDLQNKEDVIIKRFIAEDPHIHPPVGEKLDTENKAKSSSEDSDQMVTETLARILPTKCYIQSQ